MTLYVHLVTYNEVEILPWTLAHYRQFADRIFVHDGGSTDGTRKVVQDFSATLIDDSSGVEGTRDDLLAKLKGSCWKHYDCDWAIVADADELVWVAESTLGDVLGCLPPGLRAPLYRAHGFQMVGDLPAYRRGDQLTYTQRLGVPEPRYSKPVLIDARLAERVSFDVGCHDGLAALRDGGLAVPVLAPFPLLLLHYHYIGTLERCLARRRAKAARLSTVNLREGWGHHVLDERLCRHEYTDYRARARPVF